MKPFSTLWLAAALGVFGSVGLAQTAPCGGSFSSFMQQVASEAQSRGMPRAAINAVVAAAKQDPKVLRFDRAQGVFRQTFLEFSQRSISGSRLRIGAQKLEQLIRGFLRGIDRA